ncbi:MAG TPA: hypothetical protein VGK73_13650 [Polyangiaceae bacterium]
MADEPAPLSREILRRILAVHVAVHAEQYDWGDDVSQEWFRLMDEYGVEVISLAIAQFVTPKRTERGTYARHSLGPAQQRIVHALGSGPLTVKQIADLTGIHERNLRRNMVSMRARGWLTSDGSLWSIGELPGAKTSE